MSSVYDWRTIKLHYCRECTGSENGERLDLGYKRRGDLEKGGTKNDGVKMEGLDRRRGILKIESRRESCHFGAHNLL